MFKEHIEMLTAIIKEEQFNSLRFKKYLSLFFPEDVDKCYLSRSRPVSFARIVDVCLTWSETHYGRDVYGELSSNAVLGVYYTINHSKVFKDSIPEGYVIAEFGSKKYELIPIEEAHQIDYFSIIGYERAYIHVSDKDKLEAVRPTTVLNTLNLLTAQHGYSRLDIYNLEMLPQEFTPYNIADITGVVSVYNLPPYCKGKFYNTTDGLSFESEIAALSNGYMKCYMIDSDACISYDNIIYCKPDYPGFYQIVNGYNVFIEEQGLTPPVGLTPSGDRFYYVENLLEECFPNGFDIDDSGLKRQRAVYVMGYNSFSHPDHSESSAYKFGVEIEKEDFDVKTSIDVSSFIEKTGGWVKERDASLDGEDGYELVSPIYDLMNLSRFKTDIKNPLLVKHINANYTSNCGGHITISSNEMSSLELYSGLKSFFPLLYSLYPARTTQSYSQATCLFQGGYSASKHSGIYRKNDSLLEMRIFPAVRDTENLLWRIKLIQIMLKYIGSGEMSVLKMLLNKNSELNIHIRTMYKKSGSKVEQRLLNLATRYVNNVKMYNHVVLDASVLNGLKIKTRK